MKCPRTFLAFFLLLCLSFVGKAQSTAYSLYLGAFTGVGPEVFEPLQPIGYVYAQFKAPGILDVYLGIFDDQGLAERALAQVRNQGFAAAELQAKPLVGAKNVAVIQIATLDPTKPIQWGRYSSFETLQIIPLPQQVKLVLGPYASSEAAQKALPGVRAKGFADAFVRTVHPAYLHPLGDFEKGLKPKAVSATYQLEPAGRRQTLALSKATPAPTSGKQATAPAPSPAATSLPPGTSVDFSSSPPAALPAPVPGNRQVAYGSTPPSSPEMGATPSWTYKGGTPTEYGYSAPATPNFDPARQQVRTALPRRSVIELQRFLKAENHYAGATDGLYTPATAQALTTFQSNHPEWLRFQWYVQRNQGQQAGGTGNLAATLKRLGNDPSAAAALASFNHPLAQAYQAYQLLLARGPGNDVNNLMNAAIRMAFGPGTPPFKLAFDPRATYAYVDLNQFILHLHYLHSAVGAEHPLPCWLGQRHPAEVAQAQAAYAPYPDTPLPLQGCDAFSDWAEVQLLQQIAATVGAIPPSNTILLQAANQRALLYEGQASVALAEQQQLETWQTVLWGKINQWAAQDPLHQPITKALRAAYLQCQVTLEDFFLTKGFDLDNARAQSLATLHTVVNPYLQRFQGN